MSDKRLHIQLDLAFPTAETGEARRAVQEVTESLAANRRAESPGMGDQMMEAVCEWSNIQQAVRRVKANHGSAGVDGMTVHQLPAHLRQHWPTIRAHLVAGTYVPHPVKPGRDPQTGWREPSPGDSDGAGSLSSASGPADSPRRLGSDLFGPQLWVSPRTIGASGGRAGAALSG